MRRYELFWMGSIAAIAGIGVAALLTASFGARSSGDPASLRPAPVATAVATESAAAKRVPVRIHAAPKHTVHRHHRKVSRQAPSAKPAGSVPTSTHVESAPPTQRVSDSQPTPTVASPAPAPTVVKRVSTPAPKHSSSSGASFDDSG